VRNGGDHANREETMSAFVCDADHIDCIITWAIQVKATYWNPETNIRTQITRENATAIGTILLDQNIRSVVGRYEGSSPDFADRHKNNTYTFRPFNEPLDGVTVLKQINCLDYQSCESEEWEQTLAWRILDGITAATVRKLPGYENAPWGISRTTQRRRA
jgi:hypothetical protein